MKRNDGDRYLLQDGTYADPADCKAGKDGVLRAKNGMAVAMSAAGEPMTLGMTTESNQMAVGKEAPPAEDAEATRKGEPA